MTLSLIPLFILGVALGLIWKSNAVKDRYAAMKRLDTRRLDLIAENSRLRAQLLDLKSLSAINKVVTEQYGLTQNVSERVLLRDPVTAVRDKERTNFAAAKPDIYDWLEGAVINSGKVLADPPKASARGNK